jgi:hypothetical protein
MTWDVDKKYFVSNKSFFFDAQSENKNKLKSVIEFSASFFKVTFLSREILEYFLGWLEKVSWQAIKRFRFLSEERFSDKFGKCSEIWRKTCQKDAFTLAYCYCRTISIETFLAFLIITAGDSDKYVMFFRLWKYNLSRIAIFHIWGLNDNSLVAKMQR